jgi:hypothetical protein
MVTGDDEVRQGAGTRRPGRHTRPRGTVRDTASQLHAHAREDSAPTSRLRTIRPFCGQRAAPVMGRVVIGSSDARVMTLQSLVVREEQRPVQMKSREGC